jgi:hypothetical protein
MDKEWQEEGEGWMNAHIKEYFVEFLQPTFHLCFTDKNQN